MDSSPKADVAMDIAIDDASGENGGSRRPGNLWTVEAREDMFRRREAGETWETICQVCVALAWSCFNMHAWRLFRDLTRSKDYPKRSRHAMQQQYSVS